MIDNKDSLLIMLLTCLIVVGCASSDDGAFRWIDGSIMIAEQDEIRKKQQILLNAKHAKDLEDKIDGGVVFDGTVAKVSVNKETGLRIVKLSIDKILFGELENQEYIMIRTPSVEKGGVVFQGNKKYRVFTVFLNKAYRTWASSGTVELLNHAN